MLELFLAIFLALAPNHTHTNRTDNTSTQVTTLDDTGGETGHIPPTGPTHP